MQPRATVVLPITGDRGSLLRYSLQSALEQTIEDLEVFIIGDGVAEPTREIIQSYVVADPRVHFFDHPKHYRRGEEYRHVALMNEARGEIVCYLCDRDYYLPNHVATLINMLEEADFAHTLRFGISPEDRLFFLRPLDLSDRSDRMTTIRMYSVRDTLPLSLVGHRLSAYKALPHGWRTTPRWEYTDHYMWIQFLQNPDCRAVSSPKPTVLWFPRGDHPGWPAAKRLGELERWHRIIQEPDWAETFQQQVTEALLRDWVRFGRWYRTQMRTRLRDRIEYTVRRLRRSLGF